MRSGRLARMHPWGKNDHFLILFESKRAFARIFLTFRIQATLIMSCVRRYRFPVFQDAVSWRYSHYFHFPSFDGIVDGFPVEIQVLLRGCWLKLLLDLIDFSLRLLVAEWIGESEESGLVWLVAEHVLESQNELLVIINEIVSLGEYSTPFFLRIWQHSKNWLESLSV